MKRHTITAAIVFGMVLSTAPAAVASGLDVVTTFNATPAGWPYGPVVSTRAARTVAWNLRAGSGVLGTWH